MTISGLILEEMTMRVSKLVMKSACSLKTVDKSAFQDGSSDDSHSLVEEKLM